MNDITIFNYEGADIRTVTIEGEPWFVGKDVAEVLGYVNPQKAVRDHVDDEDRGVNEMVTPGGRQPVPIINESGLYSLILGSKLPTAKQFKRWVTSEVLPAIRKTGGYIHGADDLDPAELMAKALKVAERTLAERDARISALTVQNAIMAPKAEYFDALVDRNLLTNFRETAKQLGVKERDFIGFLLEKKYLYRDKKGKLLPYAGRDDLFELKECYNEKTDWRGTQTLITPKGRETFRMLMGAK